MIIVREDGNIGPFRAITPMVDRLRCDGDDYLFSVIGAYTLSEDDSLAPTRPVDLAPIRASIWEQIKTLRDTKKLEGGFPVAGKWFHSDTFSRTQQLGLVLMGANVPAIPWKTMDGTFEVTTQTLAGQIFASAAIQDMAIFNHAEALKAQVDASSDPASIDINAGWPSTYQ